MSENNEMPELVTTGKYIIIQRQDYKKIHKFSNLTSCASLGRDVIELENIEKTPYFSTFKMVPAGKGKNKKLEKCDLSCLTLKDSISISKSGNDNRNIKDDGQSQKLSKEEIEALRDKSISSSDIVNTLISNSNTFNFKTEFSQEKYLRKKEKKYFEYVQIRKPSIRLICDIMYRQEPNKILGIRIDTLSQILAYSNVNGFGNHLLYDSGTNGLVAAAILNAIGVNTEGHLIHMHPGNSAQKQALLAMNFPENQLGRYISVNLYSVLRHLYQNNEPTLEILEKTPIENKPNEDTSQTVVETVNRKRKLSKDDSEVETNKIVKMDNKTENNKSEEEPVKEVEKEKYVPKWEIENEKACGFLRGKVDSLIITAKEHPLSLFKSLVPFVKASRPFVIYHSYQEPLQECYIALRKMNNIVGVKMASNWMRGYQVLPERTHPEVLMAANSGFILTGWIVQ